MFGLPMSIMDKCPQYNLPMPLNQKCVLQLTFHSMMTSSQCVSDDSTSMHSFHRKGDTWTFRLARIQVTNNVYRKDMNNVNSQEGRKIR